MTAGRSCGAGAGRVRGDAGEPRARAHAARGRGDLLRAGAGGGARGGRGRPARDVDARVWPARALVRRSGWGCVRV